MKITFFPPEFSLIPFRRSKRLTRRKAEIITNMFFSSEQNNGRFKVMNEKEKWLQMKEKSPP
jgi:hypothetical protein